MIRGLLALMFGLLLAGCSRDGLQEFAEGLRIRAENIGAQAELRRSEAMMETGYGTVFVPGPEEPAEALATQEPAAPAEKAKPPPPPPIYVVIPAS